MKFKSWWTALTSLCKLMYMEGSVWSFFAYERVRLTITGRRFRNLKLCYRVSINIQDSLIRMPKVVVNLGFLLKRTTYWAFNIVSYTALVGFAAILIANWRASFSLLSRRGSSFTSTQRLCAGEVLKTPRKRLEPWFWSKSSKEIEDLHAAPYIQHP